MRSNRIPLVELKGTPRQMGRAHGEALRQVIAEKIGRWHEAIALAYGQAPEPFLARFLAETHFRRAIVRWMPGLLEEIAGIAEGAGIAEETAYALQLMDEEWWFGKRPEHGHCSGLAIHRGGEPATLMGQTMDLPFWHEGAQALLRLTDDEGVETLLVTSAGMVGLMGLSGRGLGLCVNTLLQLSRSREGLPVACVIRGVLGAGDHEGACRFLGTVHHASGQNYLVGDRRSVSSVECSAAGAVPVAALGGDQRVWHTNHPLANPDRLAGPEAEDGANSLARQAALARCLAAPAATAVTVETLQQALSTCDDPAAAISREAGPEATPLTSYSFAAVTYEIGERLTLHVAGGPPSQEAWHAFPVKSA